LSNAVEITREDSLAIVTLNRPEKKNAWTLEVFDALSAASAGLAKADGLRAVILTGAGGCFSAGLDYAMFAEFAARLGEIRAEMLAPPEGRPANRFQQPVVGWQALGVPVIAAIEGVAFGAGLQLALAADFRIAAPDARFSVMEAKWGLVPDMGITRSLPKLLRADQAKELIMSARVLEAPEALELGLITRIADTPMTAARAMADRLMERSPAALAAAKKLVEEGWCGEASATLALEARLQAGLMGTPGQSGTAMAELRRRFPASGRRGRGRS